MAEVGDLIELSELADINRDDKRAGALVLMRAAARLDPTIAHSDFMKLAQEAWQAEDSEERTQANRSAWEAFFAYADSPENKAYWEERHREEEAAKAAWAAGYPRDYPSTKLLGAVVRIEENGSLVRGIPTLTAFHPQDPPVIMKLEQTSTACPEQYDVFAGADQIGYLRLRHGDFSVDYPECGGETIYTAMPNGDGQFEDGERWEYLDLARVAIYERHIEGRPLAPEVAAKLEQSRVARERARENGRRFLAGEDIEGPAVALLDREPKG